MSGLISICWFDSSRFEHRVEADAPKPLKWTSLLGSVHVWTVLNHYKLQDGFILRYVSRSGSSLT